MSVQLRRVCVFCAAFAALGCSSGPEEQSGERGFGQKILDYPVDRFKDMADVIGLEFYWGQGFIAQAQATKMVQLGVGTFDGDIFMCHRRSIGIVEEIRSEAGLPFYYFTVYDRKPRAGNRTFLDRHKNLTGLGEVQYNLSDDNDRGYYELGGRLAAFLGVGLSVDIFQFLDMVTGFIGLDLGRDDAGSTSRPTVLGPRYQGAGERPLTGEPD